MSDLNLIEITDPHADALSDYMRLTDVVLRSKHEPARGLYIAESANVIWRAVAAGHQPRSFLMEHKWVESMRGALEQFPDVPVYVGESSVLEEVIGFQLHRGALAAMHRPALASVTELLATAGHDGQGVRRVAIFEDIVDHTNLGAGFRSAAALGVDAVLVTPRCADPLYRRSVRVSMGTVFQVPWTRIDSWPEAIVQLQAAGFTVAALTLSNDSVTLDDFVAQANAKVAFIFGTEGQGLAPATLAAVDSVVKIPMAGRADSLNAAIAAAVMAYQVKASWRNR